MSREDLLLGSGPGAGGDLTLPQFPGNPSYIGPVQNSDPISLLGSEFGHEPSSLILPGKTDFPGLAPVADTMKTFTDQNRVPGVDWNALMQTDDGRRRLSRTFDRFNNLLRAVPGEQNKQLALSLAWNDQLSMDEAITQLRSATDSLKPTNFLHYAFAPFKAAMQGLEWTWNKAVVDPVQELGEHVFGLGPRAQHWSPGQILVASTAHLTPLTLGVEDAHGRIKDPDKWDGAARWASGGLDFAARWYLDPLAMVGRFRHFGTLPFKLNRLIPGLEAFQPEVHGAIRATRAARLTAIADAGNVDRAYQIATSVLRGEDKLRNYLLGYYSLPDMIKSLSGNTGFRRFVRDVAEAATTTPDLHQAFASVAAAYSSPRFGIALEKGHYLYFIAEARRGAAMAGSQGAVHAAERAIADTIIGRFNPETFNYVSNQVSRLHSVRRMWHEAIARSQDASHRTWQTHYFNVDDVAPNPMYDIAASRDLAESIELSTPARSRSKNIIVRDEPSPDHITNPIDGTEVHYIPATNPAQINDPFATPESLDFPDVLGPRSMPDERTAATRAFANPETGRVIPHRLKVESPLHFDTPEELATHFNDWLVSSGALTDDLSRYERQAVLIDPELVRAEAARYDNVLAAEIPVEHIHPSQAATGVLEREGFAVGQVVTHESEPGFFKIVDHDFTKPKRGKGKPSNVLVIDASGEVKGFPASKLTEAEHPNITYTRLETLGEDLEGTQRLDRVGEAYYLRTIHPPSDEGTQRLAIGVTQEKVVVMRSAKAKGGFDFILSDGRKVNATEVLFPDELAAKTSERTYRIARMNAELMSDGGESYQVIKDAPVQRGSVRGDVRKGSRKVTNFVDTFHRTAAQELEAQAQKVVGKAGQWFEAHGYEDVADLMSHQLNIVQEQGAVTGDFIFHSPELEARYSEAWGAYEKALVDAKLEIWEKARAGKPKPHTVNMVPITPSGEFFPDLLGDPVSIFHFDDFDEASGYARGYLTSSRGIERQIDEHIAKSFGENAGHIVVPLDIPDAEAVRALEAHNDYLRSLAARRTASGYVPNQILTPQELAEAQRLGLDPLSETFPSTLAHDYRPRLTELESKLNEVERLRIRKAAEIKALGKRGDKATRASLTAQLRYLTEQSNDLLVEWQRYDGLRTAAESTGAPYAADLLPRPVLGKPTYSEAVTRQLATSRTNLLEARIVQNEARIAEHTERLNNIKATRATLAPASEPAAAPSLKLGATVRADIGDGTFRDVVIESHPHAETGEITVSIPDAPEPTYHEITAQNIEGYVAPGANPSARKLENLANLERTIRKELKTFRTAIKSAKEELRTLASVEDSPAVAYARAIGTNERALASMRSSAELTETNALTHIGKSRLAAYDARIATLGYEATEPWTIRSIGRQRFAVRRLSGRMVPLYGEALSEAQLPVLDKVRSDLTRLASELTSGTMAHTEALERIAQITTALDELGTHPRFIDNLVRSYRSYIESLGHDAISLTDEATGHLTHIAWKPTSIEPLDGLPYWMSNYSSWDRRLAPTGTIPALPLADEATSGLHSPDVSFTDPDLIRASRANIASIETGLAPGEAAPSYPGEIATVPVQDPGNVSDLGGYDFINIPRNTVTRPEAPSLAEIESRSSISRGNFPPSGLALNEGLGNELGTAAGPADFSRRFGPLATDEELKAVNSQVDAFEQHYASVYKQLQPYIGVSEHAGPDEQLAIAEGFIDSLAELRLVKLSGDFPYHRYFTDTVFPWLGNSPLRNFKIFDISYKPHRSIDFHDPYWHTHVVRFGKMADFTPEEIRAVIAKMSAATDVHGVRQIVEEDLVRSAWGKLGYSVEDIEKLKPHMSDARGQVYGVVGKDAVTHMVWESQQPNILPLIDPRFYGMVKKATKNGILNEGKFNRHRTVVEALDKFNSLFKQLMIASPRTGLRVMLEGQARAAAMGYDNIFLNPIKALAITLTAPFSPSRARRLGRWFDDPELRNIIFSEENIGMAGLRFDAGLMTSNEFRQTQVVAHAAMKTPGAKRAYLLDQAEYINRYIRNDRFAQRFLTQGPEAARDWAHSAEAAPWRAKLGLEHGASGHVAEEVDNHILELAQIMDHYHVTDPEIAAILTDNRALLPEDLIGHEAERIAASFGLSSYTAPELRQRVFDRLVQRNLSKIEMVGRDFTTRHELLRELYDRAATLEAQGHSVNMPALVKLSHGAVVDGPLTLERSILHEARTATFSKLKATFYDLAEQSRLSDALRFIFPFGNAYQEVMGVWGNILIERPWIPHQMYALWNAAGDVPGLTYTDPTTGEKMYRIPLANHLLRFAGLGSPNPITGIPGAKGFELTGRLRGFDVVSNGLPIPGPFAQLAASWVYKHKPQYRDVLYNIFPYGISSFVESLEPAYMRDALSALASYMGSEQSNLDAARLASDLMMEKIYGIAQRAKLKAGGDPTTDEGLASAMQDLATIDDIKADDFRKQLSVLYSVKVAARLLFPGPIRERSPLKDMIDFYRAAEEADPGFADAALIAKYGPEVGLLTAARTQKVPGKIAPPPTQQAAVMLGNPEIKRFISWSGQIGWDILRDVSLGKYDSNLLRDQLASGIRVRRTPEELKSQALASVGWDYYFNFRDKLDAQMDQRGGGTITSKRNRDLQVAKDIFVRNLGQAFPDWLHEFNANPGSNSGPNIARLATIATIPQLQNTDVVQGLKEYFALRAATLDKLHSFGLRSLTSRDAHAIKLQFREHIHDIIERHQSFSRLYMRYLRRDQFQPLTDLITATGILDHEGSLSGLDDIGAA